MTLHVAMVDHAWVWFDCPSADRKDGVWVLDCPDCDIRCELTDYPYLGHPSFRGSEGQAVAIANVHNARNHGGRP